VTERAPAATCGENTLFPATRMGCGEPILTCAEVFRCTECAVPFHRTCADKHFGESAENRQATVDALSAKVVALKLCAYGTHNPSDSGTFCATCGRTLNNGRE
jgi:hypothetical protein